jgi:hypothetical protein
MINDYIYSPMVEVYDLDPIFYEFPIHHLPTIVKVRKYVK